MSETSFRIDRSLWYVHAAKELHLNVKIVRVYYYAGN